jgi:hypothetical protein
MLMVHYKVVLEIRNSAGASDTEDTIVIGIIAPPDVVAPVTLIGNPDKCCCRGGIY